MRCDGFRRKIITSRWKIVTFMTLDIFRGLLSEKARVKMIERIGGIEWTGLMYGILVYLLHSRALNHILEFLLKVLVIYIWKLYFNCLIFLLLN